MRKGGKVPNLQGLAALEEGKHATLEPAVVSRDRGEVRLVERRRAGAELDVANGTGDCGKHGRGGSRRSISMCLAMGVITERLAAQAAEAEERK